MRGQNSTDDPWILEVFWYEPSGDKTERLFDCCGELIGSTSKLLFVCRELEAILDMKRLEGAFEQLDYHLENYLGRIYSLRDRLLTALHLFTGEKTDDLRHPDRRLDASKRLAMLAPNPIKLFLELHSLIDDDIRMRNMDTHNAFFHVWLYSGNDFWEPTHVLIEAEGHGMYSDIERRLRALLEKFVRSYCDRIHRVIERTEHFVKELKTLAKGGSEATV